MITPSSETLPNGETVPVSVIVPAFNRAELLPRAIASIRGQLIVRPSEIIVVDDGSTDGTPEVAESLGVTVLRMASNGGPSAARNAGIEHASNPWIAHLDSDDEWLPWCLETLWRAKEGRVLIAGASLMLNPDGRLRTIGGTRLSSRRALTPPDLLWPHNPVVASGVLASREALLAVGGYDESLRYGEDLDLWVRLVERGAAAVLPRPVVRYHAHAAQAVADQDFVARGLQAQHLRYRERPWWTTRLERRMEGAAAWDRLRRALSSANRGEALREATFIAKSGNRVSGVLGLLRVRRASRRRANTIDERGAPRAPVDRG